MPAPPPAPRFQGERTASSQDGRLTETVGSDRVLFQSAAPHDMVAITEAPEAHLHTRRDLSQGSHEARGRQGSDMRPGTAPAQRGGRARLPSEGSAVRARAQTRMQTEKERAERALRTHPEKGGFRKREEGAKHSFLTTAPSHKGRQQSHSPQQEERP